MGCILSSSARIEYLEEELRTVHARHKHWQESFTTVYNDLCEDLEKKNETLAEVNDELVRKRRRLRSLRRERNDALQNVNTLMRLERHKSRAMRNPFTQQ
jgi:septation ring formation regulator EzrA